MTLDSFTATDLKILIKNFNVETYTTGELSRNSTHLINLLALLPQKQTYKFLKIVDANYPGLSFHYVMEARHSLGKNNVLFLYRVAYFLMLDKENSFIAPMRKKLITSMLFDTSDNSPLKVNLENYLTNVQKEMTFIQDSLFISKSQKKKISKNIFNQSFENYYSLSLTNSNTVNH